MSWMPQMLRVSHTPRLLHTPHTSHMPRTSLQDDTLPKLAASTAVPEDGGADAGPASAGGPGESEEDHGRSRKEGGVLSGIVMQSIGTDIYTITKDSAGLRLCTRF